MTDPYAEIAAELRRIADDFETLAGKDIAAPALSLAVQPRGTTDNGIVAAVDAIAGVLLGKPGITRHMSGGVYHHDAGGYRGALRIDVFQQVSDPVAREQAAELARLRAELAALTGTTAVTG
ncbi:hypothetical protein GCM10010435_65930 [Winogradskya consettensis]|uniref:Uncharacterized protein n=1 Tax=Winogradskya consettensis TaxID=113560 RepID=A0A919T3R8_9ACTN|nr:hypothetical protein [Actinoplanes consettensis]GIM84787.1 hypothetical protein Aco04nite_93150 [Actinoplanes consettensis]